MFYHVIEVSRPKYQFQQLLLEALKLWSEHDLHVNEQQAVSLIKLQAIIELLLATEEVQQELKDGGYSEDVIARMQEFTKTRFEITSTAEEF